jgi:hypothetical protein
MVRRPVTRIEPDRLRKQTLGLRNLPAVVEQCVSQRRMPLGQLWLQAKRLLCIRHPLWKTLTWRKHTALPAR